MDEKLISDLKAAIREIPDWPKRGILFYDLTTLLKQGRCLEQTIDALVEPYKGQKVDLVVGIEARGFIFAPAVAYVLKAGFVPVRKPGKLPAEKLQIEYELEYGTDSLEIHQDAIKPGQRVVIADDLLATGGTISAAADLVRQLGGEIVELTFLIELVALKGRERLSGLPVFSLLQY